MKINMKVEVFDANIILVTHIDELMKVTDHARKEMAFITLEKGREFYVLVSDEWGDMHDHRFIQFLSHELNNVAMCILGVSNIRFDYENQESLCYLQDYLMGQAFKAINKEKARLTK